jgi:GTP-binding protein HflX
MQVNQLFLTASANQTSDTVGFISELPTQLIAAFRATLEEVSEADLIIHVRDVSHKESIQQKKEVLKVLSELGLSQRLENSLIEALNKVDLVEERFLLEQSNPNKIPISALKGEGIKLLLQQVENKLGEQDHIVQVDLPLSAGKKLAWFYQNGEVLEREQHEDYISLSVRLSAENWARYRRVKEES